MQLYSRDNSLIYQGCLVQWWDSWLVAERSQVRFSIGEIPTDKIGKHANLILSPTFRIITNCGVAGLRYKFWIYNMNI